MRQAAATPNLFFTSFPQFSPQKLWLATRLEIQGSLTGFQEARWPGQISRFPCLEFHTSDTVRYQILTRPYDLELWPYDIESNGVQGSVENRLSKMSSSFAPRFQID